MIGKKRNVIGKSSLNYHETYINLSFLIGKALHFDRIYQLRKCLCLQKMGYVKLADEISRKIKLHRKLLE